MAPGRHTLEAVRKRPVVVMKLETGTSALRRFPQAHRCCCCYRRRVVLDRRTRVDSSSGERLGGIGEARQSPFLPSLHAGRYGGDRFPVTRPLRRDAHPLILLILLRFAGRMPKSARQKRRNRHAEIGKKMVVRQYPDSYILLFKFKKLQNAANF